MPLFIMLLFLFLFACFFVGFFLSVFHCWEVGKRLLRLVTSSIFLLSLEPLSLSIVNYLFPLKVAFPHKSSEKMLKCITRAETEGRRYRER
ncbi:hypothetical protein L873DRAFT_1809469 [Choiromyces venosus 120613-1]|uniref:Uncharacterized protein n=1 Tax=Choiromyces venosus 120613-1 TaxID=1336337 RepID=A0A3N4JHD2_9PEZI|nr:hypothetical protein L873DRAFT_1809469 [Choiromyces venosus 120613-1]